MAMTFDEVLDRFKATPEGQGYKAHCPVHNDNKKSLSISIADDKVLIHCFAGCDTEAVVEAVGLTMKDLFEGHSNGVSHIVATYLYRDLTGVVRYRKQRTADKSFYFARPDGDGGWITSKRQNGDKPVMEGVERLLYRVNELAGYQLVFITEGEKDTDRLWSLALPATTNDVGASKDLYKSKWTAALTDQLVQLHVTKVICLPDNDDPGRAHMQAVAQSCMAAGIDARIVELPGLPVKGDVSDYLDGGRSQADLLAECERATPYSPEPPIDCTPEPAPTPAAYSFEPAFPPGHFVSKWIENFSKQCDAALEFHEAAALVALAQATPSLTARLSGSAGGLRTNLYVLLVGNPGRSRKSTAMSYTKETLKLALPQVLLPELMTQESLVESLTLCNGGPALWAVDEFTDMLLKMLNATYLAGMRGLLLELYSRIDYTYRRVSKGVKKKKKDDDGDGERQEDAFAVQNVTLSVIGCATDTIFKSLDSTAVGSGLLTRFAIVMPESKPARIPQFELHEDVIPSALVKWLQDISKRSAGQTVTWAPGVLQRMDQAIDLPIDESADRSEMTVRSGVMARKVAMLSAAGRHPGFELANAPLVVTLEDAEAAIRVVTRWIGYAQAFEARTDESAFEVNVQRCVKIAKGRTVTRREVAKRVHVPAKIMNEIEQTLLQRGEIELVEDRPPTGRPSWAWKWVG